MSTTDPPPAFRPAKCFLAILAVLTTVQLASAEAPGSFVAVGDMITERSYHEATLMKDGRVLITGGPGGFAEIYDPSTRTFSPTASLNVSRGMHTATLLLDGRVLIVGGSNAATGELYDPETGQFTLTGRMVSPQLGQTATLLGDGRVLIAGGLSPLMHLVVVRAELYDPATNGFSSAGRYVSNGTYASGGPLWPGASLLADGRVLIAGDNPPEIYDPLSGTFQRTGPLTSSAFSSLFFHTVTTLRDGSVLVAGGNDDWAMQCRGMSAAEVLNPSTNAFKVVGSMSGSRDSHTATLLPDGTVLIAGGRSGACMKDTSDSAELYDPDRQSFTAAGTMTESRASHTATLLNDGTVLITGGFAYEGEAIRRSAEIYRPAKGPRARAIRR